MSETLDVKEPSFHEIEQQILNQIGGGGQYQCSIMPGMNARASIGKVRKDHGMHVDLYAKTNRCTLSQNHLNNFNGTLDCHGGVFAALPNAMGNMAQMLLPLDCYVTTEKYANNEWKASVILGAKRLSKSTLLSTLEGIVSNGDPPFVLELRDNQKQLVALIPTKASLLLNSINNSFTMSSESPPVYDVRYNGKLPDLSPGKFRSVYTWLRWWFWPLVFLCINYMIFFSPSFILPLIPSMPFANYIGVDNDIIQDVNDALPPVPNSMVNAYQLGVINGQINTLINGCDSSTLLLVPTTTDAIPLSSQEQIDALLQKATSLVIGGGSKRSTTNNDILSINQLNKILDELIKIENHVSVITKVKGFFTFVNLMWLFAILGITISIGPSIYSLLKPLHEMFHQFCRWFYLNILLPIAKKLHSWYIFELMVWQLLILVLSTGIKLSVKEVGMMVCLTSTFLLIPSFTYTTFLKGKRIKPDLLSTLTQLYFALICAPLAIHFDSTFYGYLTVGAVFGCLGFGIWSYPLCIAIGFTNEQAMHRVGSSAFFLVMTFIVIKTTGIISIQYLAPFSSAVSVFGTIMLLLSLLIMSSRGYNYRDGNRLWRSYNLFMILMLVSLSAVGHMFGMIGMANTATVFTVLYGLEKYGDFHVEMKWNMWILLLMFSVVIWRLSLFLHSRPQFIASMFSGSIEEY